MKVSTRLLVRTWKECPKSVAMMKNNLILVDCDWKIGDYSAIKLAEAILKTRDPRIKIFDGNINN